MPDSKKSTIKKSVKKSMPITIEERNKMIAEAAYYLAEQRGLGEKCQLHDWLEAEAKIDRVYGKS